MQMAVALTAPAGTVPECCFCFFLIPEWQTD